MSSDAHPYAAPLTGPEDRTPVPALPHDLRFWLCFAVALGLMVVANIMPLYVTWGAYRTDGYEVIGWPFAFRKYGGFEGGSYLFPDCLLGDALIAVAAAYVIALALRTGLFSRLHA